MMALSFDDQHMLQDSFHEDDALMGLHELDSIFTTTTPGTSHTPDVSSISHEPEESFFDTIDTSTDHLADIDFAYSKLDESITPMIIDSVDSKFRASSRSPVHQSHNEEHFADIKHEHSTASSMASSPASSDQLSSISSSGTSPVDFDRPSNISTATSSISVKQDYPPQTSSRPTYNVHPKVSIPKDLSIEEYASQCITAAESCRLNPYSLHPEEHRLLRSQLSHNHVTTYLNIRNAILRLWVKNTQISVLRDEAIGCCKDSRWFDVASLSYDWLVRRGYINYGCTEYVESRYPQLKRNKTKRKRKIIAVIGAGISGLGCARQLEGLCAQYETHFRDSDEDLPQIIVLEGRTRIGGRVYSKALKSLPPSNSRHPAGSRRTAEMGGMIITGFDRGNPLNVLVRGQLGLPYHALRHEMTLYDVNGQVVDNKRDKRAENLYNDTLERVSNYKFQVTPPKIVSGDREHIEAGKDGHGDTSKTMQEIEDQLPLSETTTTNHAPPPEPSKLIPVSSDRITGRAHLGVGTPTMQTAAERARALGWPLHDNVNAAWDLDLAEPASAADATLGSVMDAAIMQYKRITPFLPLDLRLINWHIANLEYSNAITYSQLSLGGWDVDAGNEWEGKHTMVVGGYQQVARGLLQYPQPLDVRRRNVVKSIQYSPDGSSPATIINEDGTTIQADYVVSTIPLGVLKQQTVDFEPRLPEWKQGAIERIGFGVLNKIVLVYKKAFWDKSRDIFGVLGKPNQQASLDQRDYSANRGRFFQWFNISKTSGLPTLLVLMAGESAFHVEASSNSDLIREAGQVLRKVFPNEQVPEPTEAIVTRWAQDRFARGSYSFTGPKFQADDYEIMSKPIGNLFFAGEHTCGTHPATVHGAYISGLRAASEVLEAMMGPIAHPLPLLPQRNSDNPLKRKAAPVDLTQQTPKEARLIAYAYEVWDAVYAAVGYPAAKPKKANANAYMMYSKDNYDAVKAICEANRKPNKRGTVSNEVRLQMAKMWKDAPEEVKAPYLKNAEEQREEYKTKIAEYKESQKQWEVDAFAFKAKYEAEHPSIPGKDEPTEDEWTRDRKAKVKETNFYAG